MTLYVQFMSTIRDRYKKIGESEWFKKHYQDKPIGETIDILEDIVNNQKEMTAKVEQQIKRCIGMILTDADEQRFDDFGVTLKECLEWLGRQGTQIPTEINVRARVRYFEDGTVNGEDDDNENPKMPCVNFDYWMPRINITTGQIVNWEKGVTADIHYKVCDECCITIVAGENTLYDEEDYVPDFLCPDEEGYGDYIIMSIDADGYISNWNWNKTVDKFLEENKII